MVRKSARKSTAKAPEASGSVTDAGGKAIATATGESDKVFGPSPNPATNLIIQDVAMRASGRLMRHTVEKGLLRGRYGGHGAKAIVENRSIAQTVVTGLLARYATRSIPGAVLIGGGLVVKTLYDRSRSKREARRSGDRTIAKMAKD
ncbi:hypothetical protein GCM10011515_16120 [Tsuneonella deserti]|uniref:DUF3618 domain-containing protein n=1 Tax=Tsuneonella deserti TaxID=2035528 RepID=A0ABQ1S9U0_9SPHN|nr:hypothetical protein [Tsuneonella deserti]GGD97109.1 hypothetical protein GCM10011515_16120 [Tsuneonella deserti]